MRENDESTDIELTLEGSLINTAIASLDLYIRIHLGQFDAIRWLHQMNAEKCLTEDEKLEWDVELLHLRNAMFPDLYYLPFNGSRGISNEKNSPDALDAYNLKCAIRSTIAWYHHPEGGITVDFDYPFLSGRCRNAVCKAAERSGSDIIYLRVCPEQFRIMKDAAAVYMAVVSGQLQEALHFYTADSDALRIAEQAEQHCMTRLRNSCVNAAQEYNLFMKEQEAKICGN